MKHLLTTLVLSALCFSAPALFAQENAAASAPEDSIVELYPDKALKSLKKQENESLSPCGVLSTGKAILVFSNLSSHRNGTHHNLVVSSSADGSSWEKIALAIPDYEPLGCQANMAAAYDSSTRQVVLLICVTPYASLAKSDHPAPSKKKKGSAPGAPRYYVAWGKGGKFSKLKDVSKCFAGRHDEPGLRIKGHGLLFQGICLTKGEHAGRLLFLACHENEKVCSIYSDDHGRNWKVGTSATVHQLSPNTLGDGIFLCEAEDGTVVSYTGERRSGGTWLSSSDGGASWDEKSAGAGVQHANPAHSPNAYMVLNTADGNGTNSRLLAISLSGNHNEHSFHVALSYDWGRTWPHEKTISSATLNSAGQLHILPVAPGRLGFLSSAKGGFAPTNGTRDTGFSTFTLSWLTDGKDDGGAGDSGADGE